MAASKNSEEGISWRKKNGETLKHQSGMRGEKVI